MTIQRITKKKFKGITLRSGYPYTFSYSSWRNDPQPLVIFMYSLEGIHPKTGHQWRFLQCINFNYIPRVMRKAFAQDWKKQMEKSKGNVKFTWEMIQRRYPYVGFATRRYFIKPNYYIYKLKEIPFENMEEAIVSSWSKDFSRKIKISLLQKFSSGWKERTKVQKKAKKVGTKYGFFGKKI